jgi:hypothetical protein
MCPELSTSATFIIPQSLQTNAVTRHEVNTLTPILNQISVRICFSHLMHTRSAHFNALHCGKDIHGFSCCTVLHPRYNSSETCLGKIYSASLLRGARISPYKIQNNLRIFSRFLQFLNGATEFIRRDYSAINFSEQTHPI